MTRPKVLVADDSNVIQRFVRGALGPEGYEVVSATDGVGALDSVSRERPDAILLDIVMPLMDGFEVCRTLKGVSRTTGLPVILMTATEDPQLHTKALAAGADFVLPKPFTAQEVLRVVRLALSGGRR